MGKQEDYLGRLLDGLGRDGAAVAHLAAPAAPAAIATTLAAAAATTAALAAAPGDPAALAAAPAPSAPAAAAPTWHVPREGAQPVMLGGTSESALDGGGGDGGSGGTLQQSGSGDTHVHMTRGGIDAQAAAGRAPAASAGASSTVDGIDTAVGMETDEGPDHDHAEVSSDRPSDLASRNTKRKTNTGGVVDEKSALKEQVRELQETMLAMSVNSAAAPGTAAVAVHVDWDKIHPLVKQAALGDAADENGLPGRD